MEMERGSDAKAPHYNVVRLTCAASSTPARRMRRQQQNPGLFGKIRSSRFCQDNPDGAHSDPDEEEEELQIP